MNELELKPGIFCKGFDYDFEPESYWFSNKHNIESVIYSGLTSDIPEEIAKECVKYFNYHKWHYYTINSQLTDRIFETAKDAIISDLTKPDETVYEFCIIFKK